MRKGETGCSLHRRDVGRMVISVATLHYLRVSETLTAGRFRSRTLTPPVLRHAICSPRGGCLNSAEQIRVVLVDEHALVRAGLRALLMAAIDVHVTGEAAELRDAIALVRQTQAHVLVVDRPSGGEDGATIAEFLAASPVRTSLLILTTLSAHGPLEALLMAGARGYLTRSAAEPELLEAVRAVAGGAMYRCPLVPTSRATEPAADMERRRFEKLTDREREVLVCTAHGYTAPEIGARLNISAKTVDTYKQRIHEKLGLQHRTEYVRMALRLHLMEAG